MTVAFGHLVLRTHRLDEMEQWYRRVLDARAVAATERLRFLTYDGAHHRVALVDVGPLVGPRADAPGLAHVAFEHARIGDLLDAYERLRVAAIEPVRAANHAVTASIYYRDPDDNEVELFATLGGANRLDDAALDGAPSWEPLDLLAHHRRGASEGALQTELALATGRGGAGRVRSR